MSFLIFSRVLMWPTCLRGPQAYRLRYCSELAEVSKLLRTPEPIRCLRFFLTRLTNPHELVHELLHELLHTRQRQNPVTVFNHHLPTLPTGQLRGFHDTLQLGPHWTVSSSGITPQINTAGLKLACEGCLAVGPAPDSIIV